MEAFYNIVALVLIYSCLTTSFYIFFEYIHTFGHSEKHSRLSILAQVFDDYSIVPLIFPLYVVLILAFIVVTEKAITVGKSPRYEYKIYCSSLILMTSVILVINFFLWRSEIFLINMGNESYPNPHHSIFILQVVSLSVSLILLSLDHFFHREFFIIMNICNFFISTIILTFLPNTIFIREILRSFYNTIFPTLFRVSLIMTAIILCGFGYYFLIRKFIDKNFPLKASLFLMMMASWIAFSSFSNGFLLEYHHLCYFEGSQSIQKVSYYILFFGFIASIGCVSIMQAYKYRKSRKFEEPRIL